MEVKKGGRPPDGGWGWMVIAGCFIIMMTLSIFTYGYSILFSDFLLSCGASSTTIAWIFNLNMFLANAIGVFAGPLTKEFGFRRTSLVCCGFAALCIFALVFVDSLWGLFVFFALVGMFDGLGSLPCFLLLTIYFDRKRGRANAFLMAATCTAQFIGPPLIRHLLVDYGRQGATLLLCGITLHSIVGAALFQPVEWHMKVDVVEVSVEDEAQVEENIYDDPDSMVTNEARAEEPEGCKILGVSVSRRSSEISVLSLAESNMDLSVIPPLSRRGSPSLENTSISNNLDKTPNRSFAGVRGFLKALARVLKEVISNMKILRSPRALIIVLGSMLSMSAYVNFLMTVPFVIHGAGYSLSDAAWCMSLAAVTNLAVRLISSSFSDQPWFNIRLGYMAGTSIVSLSSAVFGYLQGLTHMQVVVAVWGCGAGMNVSLGILVMAHFMGQEKMSAIFSVNSLAVSISMIVFGPLFGLIRDASGSYAASMLAMGCCWGLSVVLWCFMPAAMAYDERKEAEQRRKEESVELAEKV